MSSSKADTRYTQRHDEFQEFTSESDDYDEADIPRHVARTRSAWRRQYAPEVELLYDTYIAVGRTLFGDAFHQLGDAADLANFIFKYMQPGATLI